MGVIRLFNSEAKGANTKPSLLGAINRIYVLKSRSVEFSGNSQSILAYLIPNIIGDSYTHDDEKDNGYVVFFTYLLFSITLWLVCLLACLLMIACLLACVFIIVCLFVCLLIIARVLACLFVFVCLLAFRLLVCLLDCLLLACL